MTRIAAIAVVAGWLAVGLSVRADDPTPAVPSIVASKGVEGTGKRSDPFMFTPDSKCLLKIVGAVDPVEWNLDDAAPDAEPLGNVVVFGQAVPGEFVVDAHWTGGRARAWFVVQPRGPPVPPTPEDGIAKRVKSALAGQPGDAVKFKAAYDALADALEAGTIKTRGQMEDSLAAALKANSWPTGKYGDLSKLSGELWGKGVGDGAIDATMRAAFLTSLKTVSTACEGVK